MADNFMTYNDAVDVLTPYAEKINTIKPEPITWAAYQLLTTAQKEAKRYVITDYPSPDEYVDKLSDLEDVDIDDQTLANNQVPVYNSTTEKWENKSIIEDSTTSTAIDKALSAKQGKVLADNLAANEQNGAKNKSHQTFTSQTLGGISHTPNEDGSLTVTTNGASTSAVVANIISTAFIVEKGTYIFSFAKDSDDPTTSPYSIIVRDSSNTYVCGSTETKAQRTVTFAQDTTIHYECFCGANKVVSDVTFYPMIRDARIIDPTFAPFTETNLQLTKKTSGLSNENLLDNGWFTVNQRGTSGSYQEGRIADRWYAYGLNASNITTNITNNGAVIQSDGTHSWRVLQNIENYKDLSGRKVTYSINVKSISSSSVRLYYAPSRSGLNDDWVYLGSASTTGITSVTFTLPDLSSASGLCLMLQSDTPIDVTIRAVKLEPGSVSTLANDVAPNDTTELLKCQRYFYRMTQSVVTAQMALVMGFDGTNTYGVIKTPVPMASTPTLSFAGTFNLSDAANTYPVTNMSLTAYGGDTGTLFAQAIGGGITVSKMYVLMCGSSNAYIDLSADI